MQRRKLIRGPGAVVTWVTDRGRIPAEVIKDDGFGPVSIRIVATGDSVDVEHGELETRRGAIRPPPGGGGRDVAPLDFSGPDRVEAWRIDKLGAKPPAHLPRPAHDDGLNGVVPRPLVAQPKPTTYRDDAHLAFVRTLRCAVPWCRRPAPSQACHAIGPRGTSLKVDDTRTFPGCADCHRAIDTGVVRTSSGYRLTPEESRALQLEMVVETQGLRIQALTQEGRALRARRTA